MLFREKSKFIPGIWRFCRESGNLGNFSGNMRYFRDIEQRFDITCYQTIYIQWYAPSVCAVFYVFWHLKTAELPMIWKDQSATFPTKIAWSSSAIDHVQSPADWHKNRTGSSHQIPSFISSGVFIRCTLTSFKSTFHWLQLGPLCFSSMEFLLFYNVYLRFPCCQKISQSVPI